MARISWPWSADGHFIHCAEGERTLIDAEHGIVGVRAESVGKDMPRCRACRRGNLSLVRRRWVCDNCGGSVDSLSG